MSLESINYFLTEEERDTHILNSLINSIATSDRNEFSVLLSGGNTVKSFNRLLYSRYRCDPDLFKKVRFYFMDERIVNLDHEASNYGQFIKCCMYDKGIISKTIPLTKNNLSFYEGVKQWRWGLFGLGIDGHVASIIDTKRRNERIYKTNKFNGYERYTLSLDTLDSVGRKILIMNSDNRKWRVLQSGDKSYPVNNLQYELFRVY